MTKLVAIQAKIFMNEAAKGVFYNFHCFISLIVAS